MTQPDADANLLPTVWGCEEEASFRRLGTPVHVEPFISPVQLGDMIVAYRKEMGIVSTEPPGIGRLDSTGGGMYVDHMLAEVVSPEYRDPRELRRRIGSNVFVLERMGEAFLKKIDTDCPGLDINRRTADTYGDYWGVHDNLGYTGYDAKDFKTAVAPHMRSHLLTRSFITGVGMVRDGRVDFSQKMTLVDYKPDTYARSNSLYRTSTAEGAIRFEVRCSDLNIMDEAIDNRLAGAAIALFVARMPRRKVSASTELLINKMGLPAAAYSFNRLPLLEDGSIDQDANLDYIRRAIDFQRAQLDDFHEEGPKIADIPQYLLDSAQRQVKICDKVQALVDGDATIHTLREDAEWAAKLCIILRRIERERGQIPRAVTDLRAQRDDLAYDVTRLRRQPDGNVSVQRSGYGYKLRDMQAGGKLTAAQEREIATTPPEDTRAGLRAYLISNYDVFEADWKKTDVLTHAGGTTTIHMPDPLSTTMRAGEQERLHRLGRRRTT